MPARLSPDKLGRIQQLLASGAHRNREIARLVGVHVVTVSLIARGCHGSQRPRFGGVDPTPEEIVARCAAIRRRWSTDDPRWQPSGRWTVPVVSMDIPPEC